MTAPDLATTDSTIRGLDEAEIEFVSGGLRWTRGTANSDVIDARGGSFTLLGVRFTFDVGGKLSSITPIG